MTKRKIAMNDTSFSECAAHAAIGAANDEPDEDGDGDCEDPERRVDRAESGDDDEVDVADQRAGETRRRPGARS